MPRKIFELDTPTDVPDAVAAASIALGVMGHAKVARWEDLGSRMPLDLRLSDDQLDLLEAHSPLLGMLRASVRAGTKGFQRTPSVSIEVCTACGRWIAASSSNRTCRASVACPGPVVRATRAKRREVVPAPQLQLLDGGAAT